MLQAMRSGRAKKFTVVGLAFLMTAFIFFYGWGSQTVKRERQAMAIAHVNDVPLYEYFIPAVRIDTAYQVIPAQVTYDQLLEYLPDELIINEMIRSELLAQSAQESGFDLGPDAQNFAHRAFALGQMNQPPTYEISQDDLNRLFATVSDGFALPPEEMKKFIVWREMRERAARINIYPQARTSILELWQTYEERQTEYRLSVASFQVSPHIASQEITDAEVEEHYNANIDEFSVGAQRQYDFIRVTTADLRDDILVTDAEVSEEYENNITDYTTPTVWDLSQIVLGNGETGDELPASVQEAVDRLDSGEEFSSVAIELSTDVPTQRDGGYVGRVEPALMDPRVVEVLETHAPGDVTAPVRLGNDEHPYWIIFKVEDMTEAEATPLSEKADEIRQRLEAQQLYALIDTALEDFERAYDESVTLEDMADLLNMDIEMSDPIAADSNRIPGVGVLPDAAAADLPRLEEGEIIDGVINSHRSWVAIIRLASETSSSVTPLEEVSNSIRRQMARVRAQEQAEADAYAALAAAEDFLGSEATPFFAAAIDNAGITTEVTFDEYQTDAFKPAEDQIAEVGPVPNLAQTLYYSPEGALSGVHEVRPAQGSQVAGYVVWLLRERIAPERSEFYDNLSTVRAQVLRENQDRLITEWFADAVNSGENDIVREDLSR